MRLDRIKLIAEMALQDMTRNRLAELSGVSKTTICNITSGKSCSNLAGNAIINALGVKPEDLIEEVKR